MITTVRGIVAAVDGDRAVIEVGGVGLAVSAAASTLALLSQKVGYEATVFTSLQVRADALQLYGFASIRERDFFLALIAVSGVGPKVALAVLSGYPVDQLESAVLHDDTKKLESIPGIGKKLAQRLMIELKDKVSAGAELTMLGAGQAASAEQSFLLARSALQNLGLTIHEAEEALQGAPGDADVADLVKFALSRGRHSS
ncbi:MAG: Holliday junction branch migration protein RuvA [Thermoleophilia bacterium]